MVSCNNSYLIMIIIYLHTVKKERKKLICLEGKKEKFLEFLSNTNNSKIDLFANNLYSYTFQLFQYNTNNLHTII